MLTLARRLWNSRFSRSVRDLFPLARRRDEPNCPSRPTVSLGGYSFEVDRIEPGSEIDRQPPNAFTCGALRTSVTSKRVLVRPHRLTASTVQVLPCRHFNPFRGTVAHSG